MILQSEQYGFMNSLLESTSFIFFKAYSSFVLCKSDSRTFCDSKTSEFSENLNPICYTLHSTNISPQIKLLLPCINMYIYNILVTDFVCYLN
jgi:hypothetical protein